MQKAYLIVSIRVLGRKCHARALSGPIPMFIVQEVYERYEDLKDLHICPSCHLPLIDGFSNEFVHET